jgi:hypothetical protein
MRTLSRNGGGSGEREGKGWCLYSSPPYRVAVIFSHGTIDSKKKIRYIVPHLYNRFFDNRNSDSCLLSERAKTKGLSY